MDSEDCAPEDASIYPGANDPIGDQIDQNCDGADGVDSDGDGFGAGSGESDDCNDNDAGVNPLADDPEGDGIDQNCDGIDGIADPGDDDDAGDDDDVSGLPILGGGTNSWSGLTIDLIAEWDDGLDEPRDLAFHSQRSDELWVVNRATNSSVIVLDAGTSEQATVFRGDTAGSQHFLAQPSALAFASDGTWASIHEEDQMTQGPSGTPPDFMGPTLWTSDLDIYDGGYGGHLDMLHNSPNGMGIAWESGRNFWVFDGYHSSLTRYSFNDDHGPGGADHSDGEIERHVEGQVSMCSGVPSHMEVDEATDLLYVADCGNNRIAVLDTTTGTQGSEYGPNYDGIDQQVAFEGTDLWTLVDGDDVPGMEQPSGLALHDGMLFISDNATSTIFAFDLKGELIDKVDTGYNGGALMGITFSDNGDLWFVHADANEVYRVRAP